VAAAIQGVGTVDAAARRITLAVGKNRAAVLWAAVWAEAGVETRVVGREYLRVVASGDAAVRLATLYTPTSTTRVALHTRQRGAEAVRFLIFSRR
jgi:copper(I)-binding protein